MQGKVSVIIPVYNRQAYIKECLESVLSQSYGNLEVIVLDDGSTDDTAKICRDMAEEDGRIQLYAGDHKGVSAARNTAIEKATGEYVFFLDSDDIIHPGLLKVLVGSMIESGAQIGGTKCYPVNDNLWDQYKSKFMSQTSIDDFECLSNKDIFEIIFTRTTPISIIGGVMFHRDLIGDTKFHTDLTIGEDFLFIYENLIKGTSVVFLKKRLYLNRLHQENTSWDFGCTGFMTRFRRRELVWQNEERCGRQENANRQKAEIYGIYLNCLKHNRANSEDCRLMRKTMKKYLITLLKAMNFKRKIALLSVIYLPFTGTLLNMRRK